LTYIAALKLAALYSKEFTMKNWLKILFVVIGCLWGIMIASIPIIGMFKERLFPYIEDGFALGNLNANVHWSYIETIWGLLLFAGVILSALLMKRDFRKGILLLLTLHVVLMQITVLHFTPKIEAFSQRTAINFFKQFEGKDVYVQVLGYKSYAHLFYTQKHPPTNKNYYSEQWLLHGAVDKPTYFICKNTESAPYLLMHDLEKIREENGFVFFKRK
jgi:hypothetical protein